MDQTAAEPGVLGKNAANLMRTGFFGASDLSGQVAEAPPTSAMNLRRCMFRREDQMTAV